MKLIITSVIDIYLILVFVFIGIIIFFGVGLIILYRRKLGLFNKTKTNTKPEEIIDIIPDKTNDELTKEAYDAYNNGLINEEKLNNRLRRIWWEDND